MAADIRLHVDNPLRENLSLEIGDQQTHYLKNVMRRAVGDEILLFNGKNGEWRARIDHIGKRGATLSIFEQTRMQESAPDLWLLFAPVKRAKTDLIVEKATELGVSAIWPVMTERTNSARVNLGRLTAIAIEAAEQSGRLSVPELKDPAKLDSVLENWPDPSRRLLAMNETGSGQPIAEILSQTDQPTLNAILIGPEGGFAARELDLLANFPFVTSVGLGGRILRAETAVIAALACWQALVGDWT